MAGNPAWIQGGVSPNPKGRAIAAIRWADYETRLAELLDKYEYDQILKLNEDIQKKRKVPLSSRDCVGIVHLAAIYRGDGKERERLFDRLWGKAVTRIGGETPGEPIRIEAQHKIAWEALDSDTLRETALALRRARERQLEIAAQQEAMTIEHEPKAIPEADLT